MMEEGELPDNFADKKIGAIVSAGKFCPTKAAMQVEIFG